jgi:hypothetical protein
MREFATNIAVRRAVVKTPGIAECRRAFSNLSVELLPPPNDTNLPGNDRVKNACPTLSSDSNFGISLQFEEAPNAQPC